MKRLFLIVAIIVFGISPILAQTSYPCDISSTGLELRNTAGTAVVPNISVNGTGNIRIPIVNIGTSPTSCAYPVNSITAVLAFLPPSSANYFCKYSGPSTFVSGKYTWTWNSGENILVGTNNQPIPGGFAGAESVLVPITGVNVGAKELSFQLFTVASSDDPSNNSKVILVTVVAAAAGPLPVTLTSMEGSADKCNAKVRWSTSNEIKLSRFEIEVSRDGMKFDKAGSLKPSAVNSNTGNYEFNTSQESGKAYYRLKIIDLDGTFTYSKVVPIVTSCTDKLVKIFPNPVKQDQLLNVNISGYNSSVKGELFTSLGQLVKSYVLKNGANPLSVENLSQGFYTLRVSENGSITETFKLNILK